MKTKLFYNNLLFRIAAPPLFGMVIYLLVLMFFDSVEMLSQNFFSREVLFVVGLTYVFFELNRIVIVLFNYLFKNAIKIRLRILIQYATSVAATICIISFILYQYFVTFEGFSTIRTELITFNSIYLFAGIFYHLHFFSMMFLFKKNESLVNRELSKKNKLELELTAYKNEINSVFLFQSLEVIIAELHKSKKQADELIDKLAQVYRYNLDNRQNEVVPLSYEITSLNPVLDIFRAKFGPSVSLEVKIDQTDDYQLIPGTLQTLFEFAVLNNIITDKLPLKFIISNKNDSLLIQYKVNEKVSLAGNNKHRIEQLTKAYNYFADEGFKDVRENGFQNFEIHLLQVEEE